MTDAVPQDYKPQPWLKPYAKRELQWLCQQLHDRNTRLQIELRAAKAQLAMYESREKAR
ncbi:hypothetical protein [Sinomonas humi]|uniref:hypothetical protein n=1 Tax=Sinomonas humi TaxID=1338436 RepID=UPI0012E04832|nr:hypothetical protein [Sinomonas humi]